MNNTELNERIKTILNKENYLDAVIAAVEFEKDYKSSEFFKITKMPLKQLLLEAKSYYFYSLDSVYEKIQKAINKLDLSHLNDLFEQIGNIYAGENQEVKQMFDQLQDFKGIISK